MSRTSEPLAPEQWSGLGHYSAFLAGAAATPALRIEVWDTLRPPRAPAPVGAPGEEWLPPTSRRPARRAGKPPALGLPGLVAIAPHVRWQMRHHLRHPRDLEAQDEGPLALFRAVAYCEFWAAHGLGWAVRYWWRPLRWQAWASGRSQQLLRDWLLWRQKRNI